MTLRYAVNAALFPASSASANVASDFDTISDVAFCVFTVLFAFQQLTPWRRGERRDERLSSIGVGAGRGHPEVTHFVLPSGVGEGKSKESVDDGSPGANAKKEKAFGGLWNPGSRAKST